MKKPIIGISSGVFSEMASSEYFSYTYCRVDIAYINSVIKAGGVPVILPITSNEEAIEEQVKILDGIILSGGPDPNPLLFDEEPSEKLGTICVERDDFEMKLINAANKHKKPMLGICRGIQILNIFFGGTLYQDICYAEGTQLKHFQSTSLGALTHTIDIEEDSFLYDILGNKTVTNSYHHQSINKIASDFKLTASSRDGIIEAIEKIDDDSFIIGVQFHPEIMANTDHENGLKIFEAFVSACK
ncbi:gamma-glutamyl-gamma-aminobutyrate hydrolase family protein [uncultured Clostridium sp.]|uniref:gamma-glutamyl-gamma-aminobutyrate hydrolase family protein n=1 Tax=uncultured Clostridium sp. TaxID=59620 RepID=UPI0027DC4B33|nr:gamma-glutamyl-gamma-aminobutyrate hydrolase family protein [uncultured Clostridium sp.]